MKILWAARLARLDLLRAVCHLAQRVTQWALECGRRLQRLVGYLAYSKNMRTVGSVGDELGVVKPHFLLMPISPAAARRSTRHRACMFAVMGPNTKFPISGMSKRQGCVSHSTPEAEIVATAFALRAVGMPALSLWHTLLPHRPVILVHEDNQAMLRVVETGKIPTMRYLHRTHRVSVAWLHARFERRNELDLV